ncbi:MULTISPECIES: MgtC/SapB family protein [unclassified Virgibacillus]|uniref:MgtC/SapB family protein n=1 Tax=unclassified Virgibacillus TaxID=2620237 RepID=UPI0024DE2239|nr:MgtC/SapB family protein [Virgibacillus sp. LDC-1]
MISFVQNMLGDHFLLIAGRLFLALVLSGLIGFERELKNHSAGFRTHILVGIASCLMMILSLYGFEHYIDRYDNIRFDPARIPSYVISGIGFLGAGTIMVYGGTIRGLTTAASIWAVAGLGLVVGAGMYGIAILTTLFILLSLIFLNNFEKLFRKGRSSIIVEITVQRDLQVNEVLAVLERYDVSIKKVEVVQIENDLRNIFIKIEKDNQLNRLTIFEELSKIEQVRSIMERT